MEKQFTILNNQDYDQLTNKVSSLGDVLYRHFRTTGQEDIYKKLEISDILQEMWIVLEKAREQTRHLMAH